MMKFNKLLQTISWGKNLSFIVATLVVLLAPSPVLAVDNQAAITSALNYLTTQQQSDGKIAGFAGVSEWAAMAFTSSGADINAVALGSGQTLQSYLSSNPPSSDASSTEWSRKILAITAAGQNPYDFGGVDYVTKLETFFNNNQIGLTSAVNDDVFGLLALLASKVDKTNQILTGSLEFILSHQRSDGGFSYSTDPAIGSDLDDTAASIMALQAASSQGMTASTLDSSLTNAKTYLLAHQNSDGGFAYDPNPATSWDTSSNVSTTSWVVMALSSAGLQSSEAYTKALDYIKASQQSDGSFPYQPIYPPGDTFDSSFSIISLNGKFWPITYFSGTVPGGVALPKTIIPAKINSLLSAGSFSVPATASNSSTPSVTASSQVTINLASGEGSSSVMLPSGTVITRTDGLNFSSDDLEITTVSPTSLSGFTQKSIKAALQWGIPNVAVSFSSPITLTIYVGTSLNGQTLTILRSISTDSGWTNDGLVSPGTCLVISGLCSFQTSKASYFVTSQDVAASPSPTSSSSSSSSSSTSSTTTQTTSPTPSPSAKIELATLVTPSEQVVDPSEGNPQPTPQASPEVLGTSTLVRSQTSNNLQAILAKVALTFAAFFLALHIYNIYRRKRIGPW